jgi:DNA-binding NtrC family response regulator
VIADRELGAPEQVTVSSPQPLLAFEFRGSSFRTRSGQLAYLYRLSGLDEEWHLTREHRVVYRDLPRGDYIFEVKAVDRDLNYSAPLTVAVTVTPAYGQIALIGALGISMLGLAVAARYGVRRRRELDRARQELVRERRQRIEVQPHEIEHWTLDDFVGSSGSLQSVLSRSRDLQRDDSRTLIVGEAGTGKELVARAIHAGSRRADHAFVPVRCAGLPRQVESLTRRTEALSTLFGHTKGAFPGAEEDRQGLLQQAQGGTLFFDEVGLLPLPLQAHLLRVLTQGEVRRTGATESERLDVRVLAGTSEDLEMQVEVGGFSRELYEYLAAHLVTVPPLRDRLEDIEPLAQQIADSASRELGLESAPVSDEVLALLQGYGFPGNVRQLRRILEQALRTSRGPINTEDISLQA